MFRSKQTGDDWRIQISDGTFDNWIFIGVENGSVIRTYLRIGSSVYFDQFH